MARASSTSTRGTYASGRGIDLPDGWKKRGPGYWTHTSGATCEYTGRSDYKYRAVRPPESKERHHVINKQTRDEAMLTATGDVKDAEEDHPTSPPPIIYTVKDTKYRTRAASEAFRELYSGESVAGDVDGGESVLAGGDVSRRQAAQKPSRGKGGSRASKARGDGRDRDVGGELRTEGVRTGKGKPGSRKRSAGVRPTPLQKKRKSAAGEGRTDHVPAASKRKDGRKNVPRAPVEVLAKAEKSGVSADFSRTIAATSRIYRNGYENAIFDVTTILHNELKRLGVEIPQ